MAAYITPDQLEQIAARYGKGKERRIPGGGWLTICPCHDDQNPSLALTIGRKLKLVLQCHAGCHWKEVKSRIEGDFPALQGKIIREGKKLTAVEAKQLQLERQEQARLLRENEKKLQFQAAQKAKKRLESARDCEEHPYLTAKGVKPVPGLKIDRDTLLIPVTDNLGRLHSIQQIYQQDGSFEKRFLKGSKTKGCFFQIGEPGDVVLVCEGIATGLSLFEATGHCVVVAFSAGNLDPVCNHFLDSKSIVLVCGDNDRFKEGNPGKTAAKKTKGIVVIPDFMDYDKGTDFNDLAAQEGLEVVKAQIDRALTTQSITSWLRSLNPLMADQKIKTAAKVLNVTVSLLRDQLKPLREKQQASSLFEDLEPWDGPVNGKKILNEIRAILKKYMHLPRHVDVPVSLWVALTYIFEQSPVLPILAITSPEKRCGKTRLISILSGLVNKALPVANISMSSIYRVVEDCTPTLLIDEADTFLGSSPEIVGIINSGHTKTSAFVMRCHADTNEPERFSTFCPKAIAKIGGFTGRLGTIEDRAITVSLQRKPANVKKQRPPFDFTDQTLKRKLAKWTQDIDLTAEPEMPDVGNDRALDNWWPLICIADAAGLGEVARKAMVSLECGTDRLSSNERLLSDIRDIFRERNITRITSRNLVDALNGIEDGPWRECFKGKPITQHKLARKLKPFKIRPRDVRTDTDRAKGYKLKDFEKAFSLYLPDTPPSNCDNVTTRMAVGTQPDSKSDTKNSCHVSKSAETRMAVSVSRCHGSDTPPGGETEKNAEDYEDF